MRRIYEYLSIDKKKIVVVKLKEEVSILDQELNQNGDIFSKFILEILHSTRDRWNLEIDELELEIKNSEK